MRVLGAVALTLLAGCDIVFGSATPSDAPTDDAAPMPDANPAQPTVELSVMGVPREGSATPVKVMATIHGMANTVVAYDFTTNDPAIGQFTKGSDIAALDGTGTAQVLAAWVPSAFGKTQIGAAVHYPNTTGANEAHANIAVVAEVGNFATMIGTTILVANDMIAMPIAIVHTGKIVQCGVDVEAGGAGARGKFAIYDSFNASGVEPGAKRKETAEFDLADGARVEVAADVGVTQGERLWLVFETNSPGLKVRFTNDFNASYPHETDEVFPAMSASFMANGTLNGDMAFWATIAP